MRSIRIWASSLFFLARMMKFQLGCCYLVFSLGLWAQGQYFGGDDDASVSCNWVLTLRPCAGCWSAWPFKFWPREVGTITYNFVEQELELCLRNVSRLLGSSVTEFWCGPGPYTSTHCLLTQPLLCMYVQCVPSLLISVLVKCFLYWYSHKKLHTVKQNFTHLKKLPVRLTFLNTYFFWGNGLHNVLCPLMHCVPSVFSKK